MLLITLKETEQLIWVSHRRRLDCREYYQRSFVGALKRLEQEILLDKPCIKLPNQLKSSAHCRLYNFILVIEKCWDWVIEACSNGGVLTL